jgi:galactose-1-phosphate uridylyltransferase
LPKAVINKRNVCNWMKHPVGVVFHEIYELAGVLQTPGYSVP